MPVDCPKCHSENSDGPRPCSSCAAAPGDRSELLRNY